MSSSIDRIKLGRLISAPKKEFFPALTGIRALAMYMVFFAHFNHLGPTDTTGAILRFVNEFYVALSMFFVLSGFLITYRYYDIPARNFREYLVNRVARVYPMYFLITTLSFLIMPQGRAWLVNDLEPWVVYVANITFIRGFFTDLLFSGVAPGWSLTPEEVFYFTAPLLFILMKRSMWYIALLPPILLGTGFLLVHLFGGGGAHGFMANNTFAMVYTFFGLSSTFYAGVGLAIVYMKYGGVLRSRYMTLLGGSGTILYMALASVLKGDLLVAVYHPVGYAFGATVLPLALAMLLWGLMTESTWLSRLLSLRPIVVLGDSSLTFYLLHMSIFADMFLNIFDSFFIWCIACTAISLVLNRLLERPADRFIKKLGRPTGSGNIAARG